MAMERKTRQREAIRTAFEEAGRPLSTGEVLESARRDVAGLGIATVYRTIKAMVEEGLLVPVELPGEPPRYETDGKDHHHHFRCMKCDRVFDLPGCPGPFRSMVPRSFRLERHDLTLYGRCAACAK